MRDKMKQVDDALLIPAPQRSRHNLDQQTTTTLAFGNLCPVFCMETVPGGSYTINNETMARFMPLVSPLMHRMTIKTHYFFVPNRILWDNWENFIMGRKDPLTGLDPVCPFFERDRLGTNSANGKTAPELADYFGFSPKADPSGTNFNLNPMAFSAYQLIYNWYYRHKSVKQEVLYKLQDGEVPPIDFDTFLTQMRKITWEDDYITSVLPTPQEGEPIFIDADAPILARTGSGIGDIMTDAGLVPVGGEGEPNVNDSVTGDLFTRTRILVEEIRRANRLQQFVELNNHAKTYIDFLKAQFDVDLQDYRLGIPEYITGFSQPVMTTEVVNQSDNFQSRLTGNSHSYAISPRETYYAREHGMIIGIAAVTYKSAYNRALPKMHTKTGRFDYFMPIFDNLGEQQLLNIEISGDHNDPNGTFGYVPKHFEYRNSFDIVTGEARTTLAHWHLGREYTNAIQLTEDFYDVVDDRRIFAFQDPANDPVIMQIYTNVSAELPMGQVSHPQL